MDCRGQGTPAVILEAGITFGSTSWGLVHDALAQQTGVCAYDIPPAFYWACLPVVFLSVSTTHVTPEQVIGMVLVDSSHEQQGSRLPSIGGTSQLGTLLTLCRWVQPLGIVRAQLC